MYTVGADLLGTFELPADYIPYPEALGSWELAHYHRSGGLKRRYYIDSTAHPIASIKFNLNLKGTGAGQIQFSNSLTVPVDPDDYFQLYYERKLKYYGIVDTQPDDKGGIIDLIPIRARLDETLYTGTHAAETIEEILEAVITDIQADTGILWNPALIDTGNTDTYTIEYSYTEPSKIINDLVDRLDDRYWGVTAAGFFYVKQLSQTVKKSLFYTDNAPYTSIEVSRDFSGISATRYQVFKKDGTDLARVGEVGYNAPYPPLDIEQLIRKKEKTIVVSDLLSDSEALDYAYAKLEAQTIPESVKVINYNPAYYFPEIGDYIQIWDRQERRLDTVIDCDTATGWTGGTLDTSDYTEGTGSILFIPSGTGDTVTYTYSRMQYYQDPTRLLFMIKSTISGPVLNVIITGGHTLASNAWGAGAYGAGSYGSGSSVTISTETIYSQTINIGASEVWQLVSLPWTEPIIKFEIEYIGPGSGEYIHIDRVQALKIFNKKYEQNVIEMDIELTPAGATATITLKDLDTQANDVIYTLDRELKKLQEVLES